MEAEVILTEIYSLKAFRDPFCAAVKQSKPIQPWYPVDNEKTTQMLADKVEMVKKHLWPTLHIDEEQGIAWRNVPYGRLPYETEHGTCIRGRLYPMQHEAVNLQTMSKNVRANLLPEGACELDLKNSQHSILLHCGERAKASEENLRVLRRFLCYPENRRKEVTSATGVSDYDAKKLFTSILCGQTIEQWASNCYVRHLVEKMPYFPFEFKRAVERIQESVENSCLYHDQDFVDCFLIARQRDREERAMKPRKTSHVMGLMRSFFLQDKEGDILSELQSILKERITKPVALIHDGIVVLEPVSEESLQSLSMELQQRTGMNHLTLQQKDFPTRATIDETANDRRRTTIDQMKGEMANASDPSERRRLELFLHYYGFQHEGACGLPYMTAKRNVHSVMRSEGFDRVPQ